MKKKFKENILLLLLFTSDKKNFRCFQFAHKKAEENGAKPHTKNGNMKTENKRKSYQ